VVLSTDGDSQWTRVAGRSAEEIERPDWDEGNLTRLLQHGWRPVRETPMGGDTGYSMSLILLEKDS
jgi:hypothetical protein